MILKQDQTMKKLAIFVAFVLAFGMLNGAFAHKSQIVGNYEIEVGWQNEPPIIGHENAITAMITNAPQDEQDGEMEHNDAVNESTQDMASMQQEHEKMLSEHEQMMTEHNAAMGGNMDKADVEEMMHNHMTMMEEHEMIMEKHESMQDQMTQEEWDAMMQSHEKIRQDHDQMNQDHEKILEMYGIDEEELMTHDDEEYDHGDGISGLASMFDSYVTLNDEMTALEFVEDQDMPGLYVAKYTPTAIGHPVVHLAVSINDEVFEADFHPEEVEEHAMSPLAQQNDGVPPNEVMCNDDKVLLSKISNGSAICVTPDTAEKLLARNWAKYF